MEISRWPLQVWNEYAGSSAWGDPNHMDYGPGQGADDDLHRAMEVSSKLEFEMTIELCAVK